MWKRKWLKVNLLEPYVLEERHSSLDSDNMRGFSFVRKILIVACFSNYLLRIMIQKDEAFDLHVYAK